MLYLQTSRQLDIGEPGKVLSSLDSLVQQVKHSQAQEPANGEKASVAKLFEQGFNLFLYYLVLYFKLTINSIIFHSGTAEDLVIAGS